MDDSLVSDAKALLDAFEKGSVSVPGDEKDTAGAAPASGSLEEKLGELLGALRRNDSDVWEGKPVQEDLGIRFDFQRSQERKEQLPEISGRVPDSAKASLDSLMEKYIDAIREVRSAEAADAH
uniref:Uncharacterized protein n=1 Tax=Trypanosoma congolense (strain IL3000) TaxID=1068625 RepID=G0UPQ1_TRYCI|nr:conserved hypothetical protein [Trypanosoma congolense IL3000]